MLQIAGCVGCSCEVLEDGADSTVEAWEISDVA